MTESISHLKKSLSQKHIQEVALETGIHPAFIEKDWFAVQLVALLAEHENNQNVQIIFSGGTSLSKGYNLIQRFSEDLDFFLKTPREQPLSRGQRRSFRRELIHSIAQDRCFAIHDEDVQRGDSHRFFKAPVTYVRSFNQASLRNHLQLEMTFCEPRLPAEVRTIQSIASFVLGEDAETSISCIPPLETAGDKLSALTWRVVVRDRNAQDDDPTIVRHLHDLAALEKIVRKQETLFVTTAKQSLEQDQSRRGSDTISAISIQDRLERAMQILREDEMYRKEYEQFVLNMSYADEEKKIGFNEACTALERIISIYGSP